MPPALLLTSPRLLTWQDLRKVAAHKARTVMLLHPAGDDAEVLKAASAMCLTAVGSDRSQGVVVQMQSQLAEAEDVLQSLSNTSAEAGEGAQAAAAAAAAACVCLTVMSAMCSPQWSVLSWPGSSMANVCTSVCCYASSLRMARSAAATLVSHTALQRHFPPEHSHPCRCPHLQAATSSCCSSPTRQCSASS
jgi:hypothetical protein